MKKRSNPKIEAMKERSLIVENERKNLHTPKFYINEQEEEIKQPAGDPYEYKKDESGYYFKKREEENWKKTNNSAVKALFGDGGEKPVTKSGGESKSSVKVPFKNTEEGNAFRQWVNNTHPDYAKEIDLDKEGSYNNSYVAKAWNKYGKDYKDQQDYLTNIKNGGIQYDMTMQRDTTEPYEREAIKMAELNNLPKIAQEFVGNMSVTIPDAYLEFDGSKLKWVSGGDVVKEWNAESGLTVLNTPPNDYGKLIKKYTETPEMWSKEKNAGPIPAGEYSVGPIQKREVGTDFTVVKKLQAFFKGISGKYKNQSVNFGANTERSDIGWGEYRAPIIDSKGYAKKVNRGSFYIHGGAFGGSHGCIDLTDEMKDFAKFYTTWMVSTGKKGIKLNVKYSDNLASTVKTLWDKMSQLV